MRRLLVALALAVGLLCGPAAASAGVVVKRDLQGRAMAFDVRAPGVDVEWYAAILRTVAHGDEIERATVRLVTWDAIARECGADAAACYRRVGRNALLVVPAGKGTAVAHALVHEYAHHLDRDTAVSGLPEPNGTPAWSLAREMARLFAAGDVGTTYDRGWNRSMGEIFAEDFTQLPVRTSYDIDWLTPPDEAVFAALRADLPTAPAEPLDLTRTPFVQMRSGTLRRAAPFSVPFRLLGPGRRVTFTARVAQPRRAGTRARIELRCGGAATSRPVGKGRAAVTLDVPDLGPASCTIRLRSTVAKPLAFTATLRLALQPGAPTGS